MWLVYVYIGFLLISRTEPYWNINSNEIDQYNPWNSIHCKLIILVRYIIFFLEKICIFAVKLA